MISKSGGARMMEAAYSLMQLAKTSVNLPSLLRKKYLHFTMYRPYYWRNDCILCYVRRHQYFWTRRLIGFAGPRVVRDTTGKDLPEGFQTAEFLFRAWFLRLYHATKRIERQD
jgi:acetyl-CoA carboxylase carboxyl transferase subunit beta